MPKYAQPVYAPAFVGGTSGGGGVPSAVGQNVWYVDSSNTDGGDAAGKGTSPDTPFATIGWAIESNSDLAAGDLIIVASGHTETVTSEITWATAGIYLRGEGVGNARPVITNNFAGDTFALDTANCTVDNLVFATPGNATGIIMDVTAARVTVRNCRFECGANATSTITVAATGDQFSLLDNYFLVTADGPNEAVSLEGTSDNLVIRGNIFDGGSSTNTWDDAALDANAVAPVSTLVQGNTFLYCTATVSTGNWLGAFSQNTYLRGARAKAGVPMTWYADASASTTGSGTAEDPTTLTDAVDLASAGDTVLLYPGTHTVTAAVAADVANLTIQPYDYVPGRCKCNVEVANDTDDVNTIDVTAAGVSIQGLLFTKGVANTTDGTELLDVGASFCRVVDCVFDLEARANADAINIATGTKGHLVENCLFTDLATTKTAIAWACSSSVFTNCHYDFSAADAVAWEQIATPGDGNKFANNTITSDDTTTAVASWQAAPGEQCVVQNRVCSVGASASCLGDDADLDPFLFDNYIEGAAGAVLAVDPSVS